MSRFLKGNLPLTAIRLFFKNWGNFTVEINTLIACSYHKHIGFFKCHAGVMHRAAAELAGLHRPDHNRHPGMIRERAERWQHWKLWNRG